MREPAAAAAWATRALVVAATAVAVSTVCGPASARVRDHDGDEIPAAFERSSGMRTHLAGDTDDDRRLDDDDNGTIEGIEIYRTV